MNLEVYEVWDKIYRQQIILVVGNEQDAQAYILDREGAEKHPDNVVEAFSKSEGLCLSGQNGEIFIWMRRFQFNAESIATFVHEVFHAVEYHAHHCNVSNSLTHDNIYWAEMVCMELLDQVLKCHNVKE